MAKHNRKSFRFIGTARGSGEVSCRARQMVQKTRSRRAKHQAAPIANIWARGHFPAVIGVIDNWAGAALLPSIYEALKASQEDIRTSSSGSQSTPDEACKILSVFHQKAAPLRLFFLLLVIT